MWVRARGEVPLLIFGNGISRRIHGLKRQALPAQHGRATWLFPSARKDISEWAATPISGNGIRPPIPGRRKQISGATPLLTESDFQSARKDISEKVASAPASGNTI